MIPIPLTVRLSTDVADRVVTADLRELSFREVALGGFASATMSLDRPLSLDPTEIAHYARVRIYDARNGRVVWEGRLEDPGQASNDSGQVWELSALGSAAATRDRAKPMMWVDTKLDAWVVGPDSASVNYVEITMKSDSSGAGIIQMRVPNGTTFANGAAGMVAYNQPIDTELDLARVSMSYTSGATSSNLEARLGTGLDDGATVNVETDALTSLTGTLVGSRGGANDITAGHNCIRVRFARVTSNLPVSDETIWLEFSNIAVRTRLKSASGSLINSGYSADTVLASEVVSDMLARLLNQQFDGSLSTVDTTTHGIDQLSYVDGVDAAQVLEDLAILEPTFRWGAYESAEDTGKYRFEYVAWPTTVRYEAGVHDGFSSPGSSEGLWNSVRVRWRGADGIPHIYHSTSTVDILDAADLTRSAMIDLGDQVGSQVNAQRAATQFLAEHATVPAGGTLTVSSPIIDLIDGRMVMPWEIRAGQLIRVRDIQPRASALSATGRDGISVFRIASREYKTSDGSAILELDEYSVSTSKALADMQRKRTRK